MLINLNGWPGAGKLTVGRILAEKLGGRLLDNHSILNLASVLTRVGAPQYYETARAIRAIAFDRILELPSQFPFVLTNVVARGGTSGFLEENWQTIIELANRRGCHLYSATLTCSPAENARRIVSEERALNKKIRDPAILADLTRTRVLFDDGATYKKTFDSTDFTPEQSANQILSWVSGRA